MKRSTREWVGKAEDDYQLATRIFSGSKPVHDHVAFHCQQAAEKYLKAVLAHRGITYRRVHSITYLLGLLADHEVAPPPRAPELEAFTPWAPQARYDLDTEGAVLDREAAIELVRGVEEWARAELDG